MKKEIQFNGFNPSISKFLMDLEKHNNKEWFDEHRDYYINEIREPIKIFVSDLGRRFYEEGLSYIADPKKSVFRINRDIRFSKNKDPYKTNIGIFFPFTISQTIEKKPESIGLYIHYEKLGCFIFGGIHIPNPEPLRAIRTKLSEDWELFEKIIFDKNFKKEFPSGLIGDSLNSMPRGFAKDHPAEKYIKLKEFGFTCAVDEKEFYSNKLVDLLVRKGKVMKPFVEFLLSAVE